MVDEVTVERLIAELQLHPMSAAKELCRRIHGSNVSKIRSNINRLLYRHKDSKFIKDDSRPGPPRWSLADGEKTIPRTSPDGKPICSHCRTVIVEGQEARHLHGMCKAFYVQ